LQEEHLKTIEEFVASVANSDNNEKIDLVVPSYALRRDLAKKVGGKYKDQNVFTEFKKNSEVFTVKKWKKRNNPPAQNRGGKPNQQTAS
jgi:hypothetical protein